LAGGAYKGVREHDKGTRMPLAGFFNTLLMSDDGKVIKKVCSPTPMKHVIMWYMGILSCFILFNEGYGQDVKRVAWPGEVIYQQHCLRCHGKGGDGKGPDAVNLMVPPRDFHSAESTGKTELELRSIIIWGLVFSPMHGWWDRLSPEEIRAVIDYIRHLAPYQPRI